MKGVDGCWAGWYDVTELDTCNNAITSVEFVEESTDDIELYGDNGTSYKIFVLAADKRTKILQVDGNDGNGYYGTGYTIYATMREEKTK